MCGEANQTDTGIPPNPPPSPRAWGITILGRDDFRVRPASHLSIACTFSRAFSRVFSKPCGELEPFFSQELFTNLFLHDPRQILLPSFRVQFRCVRQKFSFSLVDPSIIARRLGRFWRRTRKRTGPLKRIYTVQFYIV